MVDNSILTSVKKVLGLVDEDSAFDVDILMHINSALATLNQLGIGPADGIFVTDSSTTWSDFYGSDKNYSLVQSYVATKVRLLFDPPATSFVLDSLTRQLDQMEWRLNVKREVDLAPVPTLPDPWDPTKIPVTTTDWVDNE